MVIHNILLYHHTNEVSRGKSHVNGEISFWSFAKRLSKFNGFTDEKFILHLKESEFRFNYRRDSALLLLERLFFNVKKDAGLEPK